MPRLEIRTLSARHFAITPAIGDDFYEAACVCLDRHHRSPQTFSVIDRNLRHELEVEWENPGVREIAARASQRPTTEAGACALALAAIEHTQGLFAAARAEVGSGADYYLLPRGARFDDLEDAVRLEVSGVDRGPASRVERRLAEKILQTYGGSSSLPAIVAVVGFEVKLVLIQEGRAIP